MKLPHQLIIAITCFSSLVSPFARAAVEPWRINAPIVGKPAKVQSAKDSHQQGPLNPQELTGNLMGKITISGAGTQPEFDCYALVSPAHELLAFQSFKIFNDHTHLDNAIPLSDLKNGGKITIAGGATITIEEFNPRSVLRGTLRFPGGSTALDFVYHSSTEIWEMVSADQKPMKSLDIHVNLKKFLGATIGANVTAIQAAFKDGSQADIMKH